MSANNEALCGPCMLKLCCTLVVRATGYQEPAPLSKAMLAKGMQS